jgi:hypothetical protein
MRFQIMTHDRAKKKTVRKIVSGRLLQFYDNLKGFFQVDTEEFYRRLVQQAEAAERSSRPR